MNFFEKLTNSIQQNNSLLCVGLDPYQKMITTEDELVSLNRLIIKATFDLACAYKPNLAIYEGMGREGMSALAQTVDIIREIAPDVPIIGDGKRGDIGNCSLAYTNMLFEKYKFDAVTTHPYMGYDSIEPFIQYKDKGIFVLCRTSNPGGQDIQELMVMQKGDSSARPLYEIVAKLALKWNDKNNNIGLVVGATYPEQLHRIRQICPDMLFLIPGVGWQGGNVAKTVRSAVDAKGRGFIISVSRQIMYAAMTPKGTQSTDKQALKKMRHIARQLRNEINSYLPTPSNKTPKQTYPSHEGKAGLGGPPQEVTSLIAATSNR